MDSFTGGVIDSGRIFALSASAREKASSSWERIMAKRSRLDARSLCFLRERLVVRRAFVPNHITKQRCILYRIQMSLITLALLTIRRSSSQLLNGSCR
mmetsp:Transcript_18294/g.26819  ORF Transcript_18294/g.26819 Transcript_18294/m.26819 type:complete len:98 (+) Transcript_18294:1685-1978(+)